MLRKLGINPRYKKITIPLQCIAYFFFKRSMKTNFSIFLVKKKLYTKLLIVIPKD